MHVFGCIHKHKERKSACKAFYKKRIPLHHKIRSMKQKYFYEFKGLQKKNWIEKDSTGNLTFLKWYHTHTIFFNRNRKANFIESIRRWIKKVLKILNESNYITDKILWPLKRCLKWKI